MTIDSSGGAKIRVQVVHALPERYWSVRLELPGGATVAEALAAAAMDQQLAELDVDPSRLAIFSRPVQLSTVLRDGDRLELLRPLLADPKQARRERAAPPRKKR